MGEWEGVYELDSLFYTMLICMVIVICCTEYVAYLI